LGLALAWVFFFADVFFFGGAFFLAGVFLAFLALDFDLALDLAFLDLDLAAMAPDSR
jgi:hypothetical protein